MSDDLTLTASLSDGGGSARGPRLRPRFLVVASPDPELRGRQIEIVGPVTFGRRSGAGVTHVVEDERMSRRHATLERASGLTVVRVADHDSKNGTSVDGQEQSTATLAEGSVVRVADTVGVLLLADGEWPDDAEEDGLQGLSASLANALASLDRFVDAGRDVLLLGETGVGKERFMERAHRRSGRAGSAVAVNCAAIPERLAEAALFGHAKGAFTGAERAARGHFGEAEGGTLFLDEIGELAPQLQAKLLRAIDQREIQPVGASRPRRVDVRIIAATHRPLREDAEAGRFRLDLYARLAGAIVHLPPLRERRADIVPLFEHFLREHDTRPWVVTAGAAEQLLLQPWTMNVRELRDAARSAIDATGEEREVRSAHLPAPRPVDRSPEVGAPPRGRPDEATLRALLEEHGGNVARIAEHFGRERRQIYRWLARYELEPERFRG